MAPNMAGQAMMRGLGACCRISRALFAARLLKAAAFYQQCLFIAMQVGRQFKRGNSLAVVRKNNLSESAEAKKRQRQRVRGA